MPARRTGPSPGTLNDLYRLPNSVFNDDNIHAVLTGFDMLVLRTTYTPELRNGIGRVQAASIIGPLLAPAPPRRERGGRGNFPVTSRDWITAMETALTNGSSPGAGASPSTARSGLRSGSAGAARAIYSASPLMQIHSAHIAVQKAAFTLSAGDAIGTIDLANKAIPVAALRQNAAMMATLMIFKAEALDMRGDSVAAEAVRVDSLGWARYVFGSDANVRARLVKIAGLCPY